MKKLLIFLFSIFINCIPINAQTVLTYQGQTYNNTETPTSLGINVPRSVPTTFSFLYNSVTAINTGGYMLQAGDEGVSYGTNGNLNGELILGNKFTWNGDFNGLSPSMVITHGVFTGCNIDVNIKHNYLYRVPMGIIRKSGSSMSNTSGGVSYNILKTFNVGGVVKGMNNVNWYNNTFYQDRTTSDTWRGCIDIYENTDVTPTAAAHGTKVKNNIFYTKYKTYVIEITADSRNGFECDYNVYWCEEGDHTPVFLIDGSAKTWAQWQALGYDTHSVVVNPNFNNFTDFVPTARLNYGTDLGTSFNTGLATNATWTINSAPATQVQNGTWQVGARIYAPTVVAVPPTVTTTAISSIGTTTANSGGNVTSDGGAPVTERGVCWDMSGGPAIDNPHTHDGTGTGTFTSNITGLSPNTTYYVRAYATNSAGTGYGDRFSFKTASTTTTITIEGQTVNDSNNPVDDNYAAVRIDNSIKAQLYYRNNSITSINQHGYMLDAGDESVLSTNNNLDGAVITGNKFTWNGTQTGSVITHGLFTGYNINDVVKYNYLTNVPYGIIIKSGSATSNMTNTTGGVSYNIVKNGRFSGRVKGINGTKYYNNTFYGDANSWYLILITSNADNGTAYPSINTKVKNNIFYTTTKTPSISIESNSFTGFECDYNVYWCEAGDHNPIFTVEGVSKTWTQWKALGYDVHSIVINPNFNNTTDFVPAVRLNYGIDLGTDFNTGLATTATWVVGTSPATQVQNGTWQVGARVYASSTPYTGPKWYINPNGSNTTGDGSLVNPWASLYYASTHVSTKGDTIFVTTGTYYESNINPLALGVYLTGEGVSSHIIFTNTTDNITQNCITLDSPVGIPVNGNQSISYLWLDGNNLTAKRAIAVNFRENVELHHLKINNFDKSGININCNNNGYLTPPSVPYSRGIKIHDVDFDNNSTRVGGLSGNIRIEGTDLCEVYNCTFNDTYRTGGLAGNTITTNWNIGLKIHDCELVRNDDNQGEWNFFFENWFYVGGGEIYRNKFIGGGIVDIVDVKYGNYSYGLKIYENDFSMAAQYNGIYIPGTYHTIMAIDFEDRGEYEGVHVYKNKFKNFANCIWLVSTSGVSQNAVMRDINIHDNLMENVGYANYAYSYAIFFNSERSTSYTVTYNNINILNNTILSNNKSYRGIQGPDEGVVTNVTIKNNIVNGFTNYAVYFTSQRTGSTIDYLNVENNLFYGNGTNGVGFNAITPTHYTNANNLTVNPLFVGSGDYHLSATSPAIAKGFWVNLTTDLDNVAWKNPPSIGCYESTTSLSEFYLAPNGSDATGDGSISKPWFTLNKAWQNISAGSTVYMRGGTYLYLQQQNLYDKNGTATDSIRLFAYPNEKPIISRGTPYIYPQWPYALVLIDGDYLHVKGLDVSGYTQLTAASVWEGMRAYWCNHSTFELLNVHHNGAGFNLTNTNECLVINCDIHHNQDPLTGDAYGNADGLGVDWLDASDLTLDDPAAYEQASRDAVNYIKDCRFWYNTDDGIDAWEYEGMLYVDNCWSFWNGFIPDTWTKGGDGNGFKMGITDFSLPTVIKRKYTNNISFQNKKWGFLDNAAKCNMEIYNNTSYQNGYKGLDNWSGGFCFTTTPEATKYYIKNNIAYNNANSDADVGDVTNINHNTWDLPITISDADFVSVNSSGVDGARQADGSLPVLNFLKLAEGSDLIAKGVDVGLPYSGSAPDLGAYQSNYSPVVQTEFYIAPNGNDNTGDGTITKPWFTLNKGWSVMQAGYTLYVRGGTYLYNDEQYLTNKNGTAENYIKVWAHQNEKPIINPSAAYTGNVGITVSGINYVHVKGLDVSQYKQRTSDQWYNGIIAADANNCIFELLNVHHNGFGMSLSRWTTSNPTSGNLFLNCDFHHNYDNLTQIEDNFPYGGSDGLTIRVANPNSINTVRGCRMWNNSDDGFDAWENAGFLMFDNSWSFNNGFREDGITEGGDGNGFKMGPVVVPWTGYETVHKRTVQNCVAFGNRTNGFDQNQALCIMYFYNNTSFNNGNYGFGMNNDNICVMIARNNISYKNKNGQAYFNAVSTVDHNTFLYNNSNNPAYSVSDVDFVSLDVTGTDGARQVDGSLPALNFLHLTQGSDLINTGIDVGLPYSGSAPDLGAYEYVTPVVKPTGNIVSKGMRVVNKGTVTTVK
jgi:hypothetical protein